MAVLAEPSPHDGDMCSAHADSMAAGAGRRMPMAAEDGHVLGVSALTAAILTVA